MSGASSGKSGYLKLLNSKSIYCAIFVYFSFLFSYFISSPVFISFISLFFLFPIYSISFISAPLRPPLLPFSPPPFHCSDESILQCILLGCALYRPGRDWSSAPPAGTIKPEMKWKPASTCISGSVSLAVTHCLCYVLSSMAGCACDY